VIFLGRVAGAKLGHVGLPCGNGVDTREENEMIGGKGCQGLHLETKSPVGKAKESGLTVGEKWRKNKTPLWKGQIKKANVYNNVYVKEKNQRNDLLGPGHQGKGTEKVL